MHIKPFAWPIEDLYVDKKGRTRKKYRHEYVDIAGYMQDLCSKDDSEICDLASILTETLLHKWDKVGAAHHPMLERRLRRYLRRAAHQQSEMFAYELGLVKEGRQEVVSDMTAHRRAQQLEDTIEWAGRTTIITEMGKVRLSEVIDTNNRKQIAELYAMLKGLDKVAREGGLTPCFATITTPSRFHPNPGNGTDKWDGSTPKEAQDWMMGKWALVRALAAKEKITISGFRVAEGHKDGAPHGHMVFYIKPEDRETVEQIFKAIPEWAQEPGCKLKWLDDEPADGSKRASAPSYCMKYVLKTLYTQPGELDREGAWRSTWSIRADQLFGMPTKRLWRALRKLPAESCLDPLISRARYAAQNGDYAEFLRLAGGLGIKQADRPFFVETEDDSDDVIVVNFGRQEKDHLTGENTNRIVATVRKMKATLETRKRERGEVTVILNYPRESENLPPKTNIKSVLEAFSDPPHPPPDQIHRIAA